MVTDLQTVGDKEGLEDFLKAFLIHRCTGGKFDAEIAVLRPRMEGQVTFSENYYPCDPVFVLGIGNRKGLDGSGVTDGIKAHPKDTVLQKMAHIVRVAQKLDLMGPEVRSQ